MNLVVNLQLNIYSTWLLAQLRQHERCQNLPNHTVNCGGMTSCQSSMKPAMGIDGCPLPRKLLTRPGHARKTTEAPEALKP